jgi:lambda family phage portal protein
MNWLDRAIEFVAPNFALRRATARLRIDEVRRYEGAALGRRTDGWLTQSTSANADLQRALPRLRDRHRDLVQNNGWIASAKLAIVTATVGHGITTKLKGSKTAQKRWKKWSESTECDADGVQNWYGLQALAMGTVMESGECLVRRRWRRLSDGLTVPLQLQVLEPDYLDHGKTEIYAAGGRVVQGVEFDAKGKRIAYWLYEDHPGDLVGRNTVSKRVDARDVLHIYRRDRPGQVRGVPWGAPNIITVRDADDCEDAFLFRQKIANCQVGVISDKNADPASARKTPAMSEGFEPGRFDYLGPGQEITFNTPPPASDINPMLRHYLLRIAGAYGISYAALTGDLTRVNFSSGRMGHIQMSRNVSNWQWLMLAPQLLDPVVEWFADALRLSGLAVDNLSAEHGMPRREMIDPGKEIAAIKEAIRNGLMSLPAAHRELGEDSDLLLEEIAATNALLDELQLMLDSDPRQDKRAASKATRAKRARAAAKRTKSKRKTTSRAAA